MTIEYSASELVRIELLRYESPEGLHPIEKAWRDLAKKLLAHNEELQLVNLAHHTNYEAKRCDASNCKLCNDANFKFPTAFKQQ